MTNREIALSLANGDRGGFMSHIGEAYLAADSGNQKRLEEAFPHVFTGKEPLVVVVTGNPVQGISIVGPFTADQLDSYVNNLECHYTVTDLENPYAR